MNNIRFREIQLMELEILKNFDSFCQLHDLRYCLSDGTLLGAIRHHGFIPWDDDIDIYMPRPDYIKLNELYHGQKFVLKSQFSDRKWHLPFSKLMNTNVKLRETNSTIITGLWIDIFPVDGWPESFEESKKYLKKLSRLNTLNSWSFLKFSKSSHGYLRTIIKFLIIVLLRLLPKGTIARYIDKVASNSHTYQGSQYVGNVVFENKIIRIRKNFFDDRIKWDFEDAKFCIPRNYDDYLTQAYGNYMELPPVSERRNHPMEIL